MVFIGNVRGHEIGPLYTLLQHTRRHRHWVSHRITLDQGGFTTGYMHCKFIEIRGAISTGDTLTSRFTRGGIFHWWHTLHDTCPISSLIYLHQETSPQLPHVPFRRDLSLPLEAIYCTRTYSTSSEILFQVRNAVRRDDKYSVITGVRFLTLVCLINLCVRHVY